LAAELKKSISNVFTGKSVKRTDNFTELQNEFKLFEACGTNSKNLENITSALETIQPIPPVATEHFQLQGASQQRSEIPCNINCLTHWYFLAAKEIK
jgi:hypothetical protein